MNMQPDFKIAVVIVNWNGEKYLRKCLNAILAQTYPIHEIFLLDNASSDASLEGIEEIYPQINVIRLNENIGFAAGNNVACRLIKDSNWIALLNPDAFPKPDWMENMVKTARDNPEFQFFGSRMLSARDPSLFDGVGDEYHVSGLAWRHGYGCLENDRYLERREIFSPCAAAALYRKDVFDEIGGFDEDLFCYIEDVDLGFRLRLLGYRCLYVPEAVVFHVGSALSGRRSDFSVYHGHRNLVIVYFKNMPLPLLLFTLPIHLLLNLFTVFAFTLTGRFAIIMKAKLDALRFTRKTLLKRKNVQSRRKISSRSIFKLMHKGIPRFELINKFINSGK